MKIYHEGVVFKQNQFVFLRCSSQGRTLVPGDCWIIKSFNFHLRSRIRHQMQNSFFRENISRASQRYFNVLYFISDRLEALLDSLRQKKIFQTFFKFLSFIFSFSQFSHKFLKSFFYSSLKLKWNLSYDTGLP